MRIEFNAQGQAMNNRPAQGGPFRQTPAQSKAGPILRRAKVVITQDPRQPVLEDGAVLEQGGYIKRVGKYAEIAPGHQGQVIDEKEIILAPGLINAHLHLELSHLKGQIRPGTGFEGWVRQLIVSRPKDLDRQAIDQALDSIRQSQTVALGDVSGNNPKTMSAVWQASRLEHVLFQEQIGFGPLSKDWDARRSRPERSRVIPSGHALYSTSKENLQQIQAYCSAYKLPFALHLAEHAAEVEFLGSNHSSFAKLLKKGLVPKDFTPPGLHPVAYADRLGLLDQRTLAVHCVQVGKDELQLLAKRGCTVCLCPRSNDFIGVGRGPWEEMHNLGISLCLGTDSLASNWDLDLWQEALYLASHWTGSIGLLRLMAFLTFNPAQALGLYHLGQLAPGKKSAYTRLDIEYLSLLPLA
jgi:cytosine/adenosine deaminase-related metal-dependent hydrolase